MNVWGSDGFVSNHFTLLVAVVALSGGAIVTYLRRRTLRWQEEGLCPRCGSSMSEDASGEGGQVCARCSEADRRQAIVVFWFLLAGSLAMGWLIVGIIWDRASDSRPTQWAALVPFFVVEWALIQGTMEAHARAKRRRGIA